MHATDPSIVTRTRDGKVVDRSAVIDGHDSYVFPCVKPYYHDPIVVESGSGVVLRDVNGEEYLDLFSGILTTSLGHCHPEVNGAVEAQMKRLGHTSTLYLTRPQVRAARRLSSLTPPGLTRTFFTNSGSEAIDTAILAARLFTGRNEVIALRHSYHGRSVLATNLTGHGKWRPLDVSIGGIEHARAPYAYRAHDGDLGDEEAGERFARDLAEVIETCTTGAPAAFIAETILGVGGYVVPPSNYFQRAAEIVRDHGGLFICDEVQAGLGRTGTWSAIEQWDVVPDIMVLAKGIANGFPVGATVTTDAIAEAWDRKTISTYGGNPVCMAATEATLKVMRRERVPDRSRVRGAQLRDGLDDLAEEFEWIGDVRGLGLMQAIELVTDRSSRNPDARKAEALLEATRDERLLVGRAGLYDNVIRFAPSMLVTEAEIADGLARLGAACRAVDRAG